MKNILLTSTIAFLLSASLNADGVYAGVSYAQVLSSDDEFFQGAESLSGVVGENGSRLDFYLGMTATKYDSSASIFCYTWLYDKEKNNEIGLGLGAKFGTRLAQKHFLSVGGRAGLGYQETQGDTFMTQTNMTNVSYVVGTATASPREATIIENPSVFEIGLSATYRYNLFETVFLESSLEYMLSTYQFSYHIPEGNVQLSGVDQDNMMLTLGINYEF